MTDPRLDDRDDNAWSWVPGALFAMCVVGGVALWAYSSGDLQRSATRPTRRDHGPERASAAQSRSGASGPGRIAKMTTPRLSNSKPR